MVMESLKEVFRSINRRRSYQGWKEYHVKTRFNLCVQSNIDDNILVQFNSKIVACKNLGFHDSRHAAYVNMTLTVVKYCI